MEFRQSTPEPPPPLPPQFWLQQPPPPPLPQPLSSYCDFSTQSTRASSRIPPGLGLGNDYLSLGIGHNVEYTGQGIGRSSENFEMLNNVHQRIRRYPEKETGKTCCTNPGFGLGNDYLSQGIGHNVAHIGQEVGRFSENFEMLNNVHPEIQRDPEMDTRKNCINPGFGIGCNVEYFGQGTGRANRNVDMLYNINPEIQRDAEKQKIREEIIAAEMTRRQELEAEVREELRIERELALRMKGGDVFDRLRVPMEPRGRSLAQEVEGLSLEKNVMSVEESLRVQGRTETIKMDMLPFQQMSLEPNANETGQEKERNIYLAKSSADSVTQEEALVPETKSGYTVFGVWGVGNIEGKKVWRCFLCRVSATSETTLKQHFNGNKHRSKRDALKAEKSAAITGLGFHPELQVEEKALHRGEPLSAKPLDGNSVSILPDNKSKAKGKEKFAFWCEVCEAGTNNKYLMEAHKKGKKHLSQLKKNVAFWCDLCKVGTQSGHIMESHLKGKKHLNMLQEKAASTTSSDSREQHLW